MWSLSAGRWSVQYAMSSSRRSEPHCVGGKIDGKHEFQIIAGSCSMKASIQAIAWTIEIVAFITAVIVGRYLWRLGKRAAAKDSQPTKDPQP